MAFYFVSLLKKRISLVFKNPLLAGSTVLLIGSTAANFSNYLYHLLMGRMLGPKEYGALVALISLAYIFSILPATFNTTIVKFITQYKAQKDYSRMFALFLNATKAFSLFGLFVVLFFTFGKEKIAHFLNLPIPSPVILVGVLMLFSFLNAVNDGILRGLLNFNFLSANLVFGALLKVGFGVLLVWLGLAIRGALGAIVLASFFPYLVSFLPLRFLSRYKRKAVEVNWRELGFYATPVLLATLGLTSLYTTDIILVRHFFSPFETGLYASLSVLGKIIFFASNVVTLVMFPLVSEKFENGAHYRSLLNQSLGLVAVVSLGITAAYFLFPQLTIKILYGTSYLAASSYLGLFGIFITLYSLSAVLVNFFLSIRQLKAVLIPLLAALGQIILIWSFHSSLLMVIEISILVSALLLGGLLLYYFQSEKGKEAIPFGYSPGL